MKEEKGPVMIALFFYQGWQRVEIDQKLGHLYNGQIIDPVDWVLEKINDIASQAFLINQNK